MAIPKRLEGKKTAKTVISYQRSYRKEVEQILRMYPLIKKRIEQQNKGFFPPTTSWYEENKVQQLGEYISTTEKYGVVRAQRYMELEPIEEALTVLTKEEQFFVEQVYFKIEKPLVAFHCIDMGLTLRQYYKMRIDILEKLAFVMGLK